MGQRALPMSLHVIPNQLVWLRQENLLRGTYTDWTSGLTELVKVNQDKRKVLPWDRIFCRRSPAEFSGRQSRQTRGSQDNSFYGLSI